MKLFVTKKEEFKGKKNGVDYVKLSYLRNTGEVGEIFTTKEKYDSFKVNEDVYLSSQALQTLLADADTIDVEFDNKGYLVGIEN